MKGIVGIILAAIAIIAGYNSVYTVDQREKALVLVFGEVIQADVPPGLHVKAPWHNVLFFDARVQTLDADPERYLTQEKKNLVVDSFVKWRIQNVQKYYVTVSGLKSNARARLAQRVNDSLRVQFGKRSVQDVISGDRVQVMEIVREAINIEAKEIGVDVIDVRLKRVDLDEEISKNVYSRMEAERARVANDFRAKGAEAAERIRADADRQREILLANAYKEAELLRGAGDATTTKIYAEAFSRDQEFYALYRSLNAYQRTFKDENDLLVLEPDSEFFKYFKQANPTGKSSPK